MPDRTNSPARLSRRDAIALSVAAGAALVTGGPEMARAQASPHRFKVGDADVTVFSDGQIELPPAFVLPGREPAEVEAVFRASGRDFAGFRAEVNVALVKTGKELVLIDSGAGPDFMPTLGKLAERLDAAGVRPGEITRVVFTHAHADHLWGVIDPLGGDTFFENATHLMTAPERDYWLADGVETRVPTALQGMAAGTQRRLKTIAARIEIMRPGTEIAPGISTIDTAGHTPGHVSLVVGSGSDTVVIGGDALTQSVVSFAKPDWRWGPDMDPDKAVAARRRLLDRLASERTRLLGYHLPWPGLGYVERKDGAYRFVPA
jgi:glyoxylase-like metal-dependent hydrolase (beta-lactamase superfamily II)